MMSKVQCMIGFIYFFQISNWTFVATEYKILFLKCTVYNLKLFCYVS